MKIIHSIVQIMKQQRNTPIFLLIFFLCIILSGCSLSEVDTFISDIISTQTNSENTISMDSIPEFSGEPYVEINNNEPEFEKDDGKKKSFETYSPLDSLGRCGVAYANIGEDLMPTEERGSISHIKPSGWNSVKYNNIEGRYLYNRCHLIGFQLTGENANPENLITGTRYLNIDGMLSFENEVTEYIKETKNHVLYRVTPIFEGDNLVASGVQMEGWSVEDNGDGICFNIFAYNCQPGIEIDYATGDSKLADNTKNSSQEVVSTDTTSKGQSEKKQNYIINKNTKKFHIPSCGSIANTSDENKEKIKEKRSELIADGYTPCGKCNP